MFEVEVKAKFSGTHATLVALLEKLGAHQEKEVIQADTLFLPQGMQYDELVPGMPVMRIRDQSGKYIFNVKRKPNTEAVGIEHETEIVDAVALQNILETIGYTPALYIKKKRQEYKLNDLSICADEVENLGVFIEVEKLVEVESLVNDALTILWQFLRTLGIKEEDKVKHGYDTLINRKLQNKTSG